MSQPKVILNDVIDSAIKNRDELLLNISFNEYNPVIDSLLPEYVCTGGNDDAVNYVKQWLNTYGFNTKIPSKAVFSNFDISGYTHIGSDSNTIVRSPQEEVWKLEFLNESQNFSELASNLRMDLFLEESDYVTYRYVIRNIPDYIETILLAITFYLTVKESIQVIDNSLDVIKESINSGIDSVSAALKVAATILINAIYIAAIIIALVALLKEISENLFAKPRKYYALDVYDTIQKGCEYLGYSFVSDELRNNFDNLTYARHTSYKDNGDRMSVLNGKPENQPIPEGGLLDFINKIATLFNGKLRVTSDKTVNLEPRTTYENNPLNIRLNDLHEFGEIKYKSSSALKYIYIGYVTDSTDKNSFVNEAALTYNLDTSQIDITTELQKGLEQSFESVQGNNEAYVINLPFFMPDRKSSQTDLEKFFNSIFDVLAGLNKQYQVKNGDRIGFMQLATDVLPSDTIFIRDGEKIASNSFDTLSAGNLITYYEIEGMDQSQWIEVTNRGNDPLCEQSGYEGILDNNVIYNNSGEKIIIQSNSFNPRSGLFELSYMRRLKEGELGYISPSQISKKRITHTKNG